ncbi:MAG: glycosyltransferase [Rhodobacterales bacterium]|nr:glycosyltransferase [Rhodobacterales bacterium]
MRLFQAMAGAAHGGAEAFFVRLAVALEKTDVAQTVAIRRHRERAAALRAGGVAPLELPFGGALDVSTRLALGRAARRAKPDVVLTWMNRATRLMPRGPWVQVARLGGYYDLKYYRRCHHLIGNTQDIVDYLVDAGWPAERAHYLPNFPDDRPVEPVDRAALDTPADAPLLVALGRLHVNKAFDVLIDALAAVPGAWLWLAGAGPLDDDLKARAAAVGVAGRLRFLGWRDDAGALLRAADLCVVPSRHEPLGNVVLEAWAAGTPVVAAASQGPGALITDGADGRLVPVNDAPALAQAIAAVLADPALAARLAAGGAATFRARYAEDAVVARYLDFFRRVAG